MNKNEFMESLKSAVSGLTNGGKKGLAVSALCLMALVQAQYQLNKSRDRRHVRRMINTISPLDSVISHTGLEIDSIRLMVEPVARDSMMRNSDYSFVANNQILIAPLEKINDSLLNLAVNRAQRTVMLTIVPHDERVFGRFAHVRDMNLLASRYAFNKGIIEEYYERSANVVGYEQAVRNHFDSLANVQIAMRQKKIDSLMNKKAEIINRASRRAR